MTKLDKKSHLLKQTSADQKQRFSIRKLNIGAASVLLGTTLLFGTGAVTHADTTDQTNSASDNTSQTTNDNSQSSSNNAVGSDSTSDKQTRVGFLVNGQTQDNQTISTGSTVQINFQTNDYNDGDKFIFKIHPENTTDIDITNNFNVTPANDKPTSATVSSVDKQSNAYQFSDTMHGSGTYNQIIAVGTSSTFSTPKLMKDGNYKILIDVYKEGSDGKQTLVKTNYFTLAVKHNAYLYWKTQNGFSYDSTKAVYTLDGNQVTTGVIASNTDYEWRNQVSFSPQFSEGFTVTIPVPTGFVLTKEATDKLNATEFANFNGSVKQDGTNIIFTYNRLSDEQYAQKKWTSSTYIYPKFIGKITTTFENITKLTGASSATLNAKSNTDTSGAFTISVLGSNNTADKTPTGSLFSATIDPDKVNKMHNYYPEQPINITTEEDSKKSAHNLNNNIVATSASAEQLNGVDLDVIVPDGMNISKFTQNGTPTLNPTYYYEYIYGSKSATFTNDNILTAPSGEYIKKIHAHFDSVPAYNELLNINLYGVLADNYRGDNDGTATRNDGSSVAKGDKLADYDNLSTKISITLADSKTNSYHNASAVWTGTQTVLLQNPDTTIYLNKTYAIGNQTNMQAGNPGGTITIEPYDFQNAVPNITYYVVLPTNAYLDPENPFTGLPANASVSYFKTFGFNVVKIQLKGGKREDYVHKEIVLNLDNSTLVTNKNLQSGYAIFAVVPDGQKNYLFYSDTSVMSPLKDYDAVSLGTSAYKCLPFVENNTNAYQLRSGSWNLVSSVVTTITTEAEGNQNSDYTPGGKSDDKGDTTLRFASSLINGEPNDMKDVKSIIQIPNLADGKSQFDFHLTKAVKVYDVTNNDDVTSDVTVYYTTNAAYKNKKMSEISIGDWKKDFTTTPPTDLSTVTAVAVEIPKIPTQHLFRIVIEGTDPNFIQDAGKTAYVANKIWGDSLLPKNIELGKTYTVQDTSVSAKLTIVGESTIHVKMHYQDPDGTDHYIDGSDVVLNDNVDTLTKTGLLTSVYGIDPNDLTKYGVTPSTINNLNDNPDFRAQLLKKYPGLSDYAVDFTKFIGPNSDSTPKAEWDQIVRYYFNNNTVTFELTKLEHYTDTVTLARDTKFVSNADGSTLKNDDLETGLATKITNITYDPLTDHYTVEQSGDQLQYSNYQTKDDIDNYKLDATDATLAGPSADDISKVLSDYSKTLFAKTNKVGYTVEMTKKSDGTYDVKLTQNDQFASGAVNIIYHQVAHYNPQVNITISTNTSYINDTNGEKMKADVSDVDIKSQILNTTYDQTTHNNTSYDKLNDKFTVSYADGPTFAGYEEEGADMISAPSSSDIQKVIDANKDLIFNSLKTSGVKIVMANDKNNGFTSTVTADASVPKGKIAVVLNVVHHYDPVIKVELSQLIDFLSNADGSKVIASINNIDTRNVSLVPVYDAETHKVIGISFTDGTDIENDFDMGYITPREVSGYTIDQTAKTLNSPESLAVFQMINDNRSQLFDLSNQTGMRIDFSYDGEKIDSKITPDSSVAKGNVALAVYLTALYNPIYNVTLSQTNDYVSAKTGDFVKPSSSADSFANGQIKTVFDSTSHQLTSYTDLPSNLTYAANHIADDVSGYKLNSADSLLEGPQSSDLAAIIAANKAQLFDGNAKHGFTITVTKTANGYTGTVSENTALVAHTFAFVYDEKAHFNPMAEVTVSRETSYINDIDGSQLQAPTETNDFSSATLNTEYDQDNHALKSVSSIPDSLAYATKTAPEFKGYKVVDGGTNLTGPTSVDLQKIISENQATLFAATNTHGYKIDINKNVDGTFTAKLTQDESLDAGKVAILYHEVAHYNPIETIHFSQETKYVSNATGDELENADKKDNFHSTELSAEYDADTHQFKNVYFTSNTTIDDFKYDSENSPEISGYKIQAGDETLQGPSATDVMALLVKYQSQLYDNANKTGMRLDFSKDGDDYKATVTADSSLAKGEVNFVYHEVAHYNPIYTVTVSRNTDQVSDKSGEKLKDTIVTNDFAKGLVDTIFDSNSHQLTSYDALPTNIQYADKSMQDDISGYTLNTADYVLHGPQNADLATIIATNKDQLFAGDAKHGFTVTVTKTANGYTGTVSENTSLSAHTIAFVYNETAHFNPIAEITVSQEIKYVSNATGEAVHDLTENDDFNTAKINTEYDAETHQIKSIGSVPADFDYQNVASPNVANYIVDDSDKTLTGLQDTDIQKILNDYKDTLFANNASHGYKIDVTKVGNEYKSELSEDNDLAAGQVAVVLHQVAHYNPDIQVSVSRETTYVSNKTGQQVKKTDENKDFNSTTLTTKYDQTNHSLTSFSNVPTDFAYPDKQAQAISGYEVDTNDQVLKGLSSSDLQKILTDNQDKLFAGDNAHGMRVDITNGVATVTEDSNLPAKSISVVYHETAHYHPVSSVEISREVKYVSNATGEEVAKTTDSQNLATTNISTTYTDDHKLTAIGSLPTDFSYDQFNPSNKVAGYELEAADASLSGLTEQEIQQILESHKDQLFDANATSGYKLDVTKDGDKLITNVVADKTLPAGKVNIVLHQVAHYNPDIQVSVSRETTYVLNKTGQQVKQTDENKDFKTTTLTTEYDVNSHEIKHFSDLPTDFAYGEVSSPVVKDHTAADQTLPGLSSSDLHKILLANQDKLMRASNKTGMRVDIDDHGDVTISEDSSLPAKSISVVYHEIDHYNPVVDLVISREIDYVSTATGKEISKPTKSEQQNPIVLNTEYDPTTKEIKNFSAIPENYGFADVTVPEIAGYTTADQTLAGLKASDLQKLLTDNQATLFNYEYKHGLRMEVVKAGDQYTAKITQDDSLPAGKINVVLKQVANYNPTSEITLTSEYEYLSDGKAVKSTDTDKDFKSATIQTNYDPNGHQIISISNLPDGFAYQTVTAPNVNGYSVDPTKQTITGPQVAELQKILTDNKDQLFDRSHKYGMRVDIVNDSNNNYSVNITEDPSLAAGKISIVFHDSINYLPVTKPSNDKPEKQTTTKVAKTKEVKPTTTTVKATSVVKKQVAPVKQAAKTLPQTGDNSAIALLAGSISAFIGLLGLGYKKKK
ncbi:MAG: YSIRK-type signal peptide-containing protein [Lactobacillus sp.]|nr:YSIRK-type signal peptide-containing protein [Lactobacillus sp.]